MGDGGGGEVGRGGERGDGEGRGSERCRVPAFALLLRPGQSRDVNEGHCEEGHEGEAGEVEPAGRRAAPPSPPRRPGRAPSTTALLPVLLRMHECGSLIIIDARAFLLVSHRVLTARPACVEVMGVVVRMVGAGGVGGCRRARFNEGDIHIPTHHQGLLHFLCPRRGPSPQPAIAAFRLRLPNDGTQRWRDQRQEGAATHRCSGPLDDTTVGSIVTTAAKKTLQREVDGERETPTATSGARGGTIDGMCDCSAVLLALIERPSPVTARRRGRLG